VVLEVEVVALARTGPTQALSRHLCLSLTFPPYLFMSLQKTHFSQFFFLHPEHTQSLLELDPTTSTLLATALLINPFTSSTFPLATFTCSTFLLGTLVFTLCTGLCRLTLTVCLRLSSTLSTASPPAFLLFLVAPSFVSLFEHSHVVEGGVLPVVVAVQVGVGVEGLALTGRHPADVFEDR